MNKNQLVIIAGLIAYIIGGAVVVAADLETFFGILRFKSHLLMPIFKTYSILLIAGIALIYFFRDKKE